jgi:FHA domain-containing protein
MPTEKHSTGSFFSELRRRKVTRTCVLYILLCWGALQVIDIIAPAVGYDADTLSRYLLYLSIAGFPVTFALAWFYQITSAGILRTNSFVERRVLANISPINDRRVAKVSSYFRKGEDHPEYRWIISAETGPLSGLSFGVTEPLVLGRSLDCDIAMVTPHVSRQHARLELEDGQLFVEDLGSANGTVINGKPVQSRQALHHEDELRFHDIVFRVTESYSGSLSEKAAMNQTTFIQSQDG